MQLRQRKSSPRVIRLSSEKLVSRIVGGRLALAFVFVTALLSGACEGENLFGGGTGGGPDNDVIVGDLTVTIDRPGEGTTAALGDSLFVSAFVVDSAGIDNVHFIGVGFRGDSTLGTFRAVTRFQPKTVNFGGEGDNTSVADLPVDTLLRRYLHPTGDGTTEEVAIIVTAQDANGLTIADTSFVQLGGPSMRFVAPENDDTLSAGTSLGIMVVVTDPSGITSANIQYEGITTGSITQSFEPAQDSVLLDTIIQLPAESGTLELSATATNTFDQVGRTSVIELPVVQQSTSGNEEAPTVALATAAPERMELLDPVQVTVTGQDNSQGSGITRMGYTVIATNSAGNTVVTGDEVTYDPPRTATTVETFFFDPSIVADELALPDTLTFEVHAYAEDAAGNCAATVSTSPEQRPCGTRNDRNVAQGTPGQSASVIVVTGFTVDLPDGAVVADAVIDTANGRDRIYLSNQASNQISVLRMADSTLIGSIEVGSQPWGVFVDNSSDTLLVANSGGTNISFVPLLTGGNVDFVPNEDLARRLLTPNVVLYDLLIQLTETGVVSYRITLHDFSDRPQFIAQDSTGRYLYSTVPTFSATPGTIRLVDENPDPASTTDVPEARILFEASEALGDNVDNVAIANIDSIIITSNGTSAVPTFCDHIAGYPDDPANVRCVESTEPTPAAAIDALNTLQGQTLDPHIFGAAGKEWNTGAIGMSDTTYVAAAGDRGTIAFGEGATAPTGRVVLWDAADQAVSEAIEVIDLINNASERVLGVGLNQNGTLGVARGTEAAYFFTEDLRLQGQYDSALGDGGAGAALHPNHNAVLETGESALAFIPTSNQTIRILDTTHFNLRGVIHIRDNVIGPLRSALPIDPTQGVACSGPDCKIVKLFGVTATGGVVIVDVYRRDVN